VLKIVDRYVGKATIQGMMVVWFAMTILFMLIKLLSELRATEGGYSTGDAFWFIVLSTPRLAYQVFPVSALLGALVGAGGLAAANELVAFRTSGVSRLRLALAALAGALFLTLPVMVVGEWLAPAAEHQARAFRLSELVGQAIIGGSRGMWMRDGADIVNIQRPLLSAQRGEQSVAFNEVVIYNFSEDIDLQSITRAASASHNGGSWTLDEVSIVTFNEKGARQTTRQKLDWSTQVKPELLDSAVSRPKWLSLRSLREYLHYLGENGLDDRVYQEAFWQKVLFPITVLALVLAGMPFVFGSARSQNMGVRLFFGMIVGGVYIIVSDTIQRFGSVYDIPALLSNLLPPLLLMSAAIMALRRAV
jgi:lipopolysaccharide export system permease protein